MFNPAIKAKARLLSPGYGSQNGVNSKNEAVSSKDNMKMRHISMRNRLASGYIKMYGTHF